MWQYVQQLHLTEVSNVPKVWESIKKKICNSSNSSSNKSCLGEEFGMEPGTIVTGKMVAALRRMGFEKVFDTDFAADLTIVEEAQNLSIDFKMVEDFQYLTSCCPSMG